MSCSFAPRLFLGTAVLASLASLSACNASLQTPEQAVANMTMSAQANARHLCQQHRDSREYFDCVKRANETYEAWRREERTVKKPTETRIADRKL